MVPGPSPIRDQAIADIKRHLAENGPGDWGELRAKYSSVSEPTWWRWVKQARMRPDDHATLASVRKRLAERVNRPNDAEVIEPVSACLPAAAPVKTGADLDLLEKFTQLYDDAMMLREFSLDSDGRLKNPMIMG
jgi:hypothetical protein